MGINEPMEILRVGGDRDRQFGQSKKSVAKAHCHAHFKFPNGPIKSILSHLGPIKSILSYLGPHLSHAQKKPAKIFSSCSWIG